jgi:hypothetical protein
VQATDPRAIVAAPTSPRLSRRGAAQPEWARWLSPGAVLGFCREYWSYGGYGLCEGCGFLFSEQEKKEK